MYTTYRYDNRTKQYARQCGLETEGEHRCSRCLRQEEFRYRGWFLLVSSKINERYSMTLLFNYPTGFCFVNGSKSRYLSLYDQQAVHPGYKPIDALRQSSISLS
jgi:hypothetical protein